MDKDMEKNFFMSEKECKESFIKTQTNPRYPSFRQIHFTAGDIEQFFSNKNPTNGSNPNPEIDFKDNIWKDFSVGENITWQSYNNITTEDVDNTFRYLFKNLKKQFSLKLKTIN